MQALSLMKAHVHRQAVETTQVVRVVELEMQNSKLLVVLEQTRAAFVDVDATQNSLSPLRMLMPLRTLCPWLRRNWKKSAQASALLKLRELRINLEKAMNEIGERCLPHPGKGSAIGEIVELFDKEIQALSGVITKANKNFLCYCLSRVLRMLYENVDCDHLDGLEAIMNSYDASLLNDIPDEIAKLSGRIVRKWWSSHGLPYVMDIFRIVLDVRVFNMCCDV
jgi:hypothetical protein